MKAIKLDHELAKLVLTGKKTSTWRLYDDKDLSVNDEVEIIDKVDPKDPETWQVAAHAVIDTVIQKRLGDVVESDYGGHEQYASQEEMLQDFQHYYGPQVTLKTPVKMIHFTLLSKSAEKLPSSVKGKPRLTEVKMYADGGSRGNPGPSASGYVIYDMDSNIVVKKGIYLGVTTNNQAEYQALKFGLEDALQQGAHTIHVYMDSMLVVNQMKGIFKVKNRDLWPIHDAIKKLASQARQVTFTHVPRALNKAADAAVNEALDAHHDQLKQRS